MKALFSKKEGTGGRFSLEARVETLAHSKYIYLLKEGDQDQDVNAFKLRLSTDITLYLFSSIVSKL